jgi:hypothetical protein
MAFKRAFLALVALSCSVGSLSRAQVVTYQGQLKSGGVPVNGTCDINFRLFADAEDGTQIGASSAAVAVTGGVFTSSFSLPFDPSSARYLDLQVRCPTNVGPFTQLTPRQAITTVVGHGSSHGAVFTASDMGLAVYAKSGLGIWSTATGSLVAGVKGTNAAWFGVWGDTTNGVAVYGAALDASGEAFYAQGNAKQERTKSGWIKALVRVFGDSPTRCFRGDQVLARVDANTCSGFSVSGSGGANTVTFPFQVNDRYVVVTPEHDASVPVFSTYSFTGPNQVLVRTWGCTAVVGSTPCALYGSAFTIAIY